MTSRFSRSSVRDRPAVRCATLRVMFGISLFAATGAGAGSAGVAHAAAPAPQQAAVVSAR